MSRLSARARKGLGDCVLLPFFLGAVVFLLLAFGRWMGVVY